MSRFGLERLATFRENAQREAEAAAKATQETMLRAARIHGVLAHTGWTEEISMYMDAYTRAATLALVERPLDAETANFLRGKAAAYRDLQAWIDGIFAAASEARRDASDEENEAQGQPDNLGGRRF